MRSRLLGVLPVVSLVMATAASADVVIDWNGHALGAIRTDRTSPPKAARALAIAQVSVYDAVNAIAGRPFEAYLVTTSPPGGASAEAAAAAAAHRALAALYPNQQADLDAKLVTSLAAIPDGPAETSGVAFGVAVADQVLAARANDHASDIVAFEAPEGASWWIPTPPAFAAALLPNWPRVIPWSLDSGAELRPAAPPPPNSAEHTAALLEVQSLGSQSSATRTADQTQIALFWADGAGTATPPGHWHLIAQSVSQDRHLTLLENARLFALLGIAVADAAIVSWDAKYAYSCWRPVTAIREADHDGNPATAGDPAWNSLIATPPFPAYTSGHSTFSSASARVLSLFFGTDAVSFTTTSDALPGVTRSFTSFSQAAAEAGQSRIYGGIHFQYDNQAGLATGRALGEHVFFGDLGPRELPGTCIADATTLCLEGGRFRVRASFDTGTAKGQAQAIPDGGVTGSFWFFHPDNTELTIKVLNACGPFDRFWVFASGLTNVEVTIKVTDTATGRVRRYFNPLGTSYKPVQDVSAFATCP